MVRQQGDLAGGAEVRSAEVEGSADASPEQACLALDGERPAGKQVPFNVEAVGDQGAEAALRVRERRGDEVRVVEHHLAADARVGQVDPGCRREAVPQLQVPGGAQPPGAQAGNVAVAEADHAGDGVVEAGRLVEPAPLQQQRAGQGPSFQVERAGDAGTAQPYRPGRLPAARRPGCEQLDDQAGAYLTAVGTVRGPGVRVLPGVRVQVGQFPGPRCVGDLLLGSGKWLQVGHWQFLAGCGTGTTYCYVTDRPRITKDGVPRSRRSREQGSAVAGRGPVAQHVGRVDRRDRTGLRSAVPADLAGPDVELAQVRKPVPDARLHGLADPGPAAPPKRPPRSAARPTGTCSRTAATLPAPGTARRPFPRTLECGVPARQRAS